MMSSKAAMRRILLVLKRFQGAAPRNQRGSVVLIVAAVLLILGALLASVQVGYNYFVQQRLQKAADLAALSAVQVLGKGCEEAKAVAQAVAAQNGVPEADILQPIECGRWARKSETQPWTEEIQAIRCGFKPAPYPPPAGALEAPVFTASSEYTGTQPLNAVRVGTRASLVSFLPKLFGGTSSPDSGSSAAAVATAMVGPQVATFSVGSRLLSLKEDAGLAPVLLESLGLDPQDVRILDSEGLANVTVTPAGLLQALGLPASVLAGVGTTRDLAKLEQLKLADVLDAYVELLGQSQPAAVVVLKKLRGQVDALDLPIKLLGEHGLMLYATAANLTSALSARLSLADLIGASALVANGENLLNLGTSIPGLLSLKAQVVHPPTFGLAIPVYDDGHPCVINNSQIQLKMDLMPALALDIPFLFHLNAADLPITVGIANSAGKLVGIASDGQAAQFSTKASAVNVCIGDLGPEPCVEGSSPAFSDLADVELSLLGLPILSVAAQARANVRLIDDPAWSAAQWVDACEVKSDVCEGKPIGGLGVGVRSVIRSNQPGDGGLETNVTAKVLGVGGSLGLVDGIVDQLVNQLLGTLNDGVLSPLLGTVLPELGIDLNQTDILLYPILPRAPYIVQ